MAIQNKNLYTYDTFEARHVNANGPIATIDDIAYSISGTNARDKSFVPLSDKLSEIDTNIYNAKTSADSSVKGVDDDTNKVTLASGEVLTIGRFDKNKIIAVVANGIEPIGRINYALN